MLGSEGRGGYRNVVGMVVDNAHRAVRLDPHHGAYADIKPYSFLNLLMR
jgi:hypothetical protein